MNPRPNPQVIQQCRDGSRSNDSDIGKPGKLRHQESRRSHNWRHKLSPRRCCGLHRTGKLPFVAQSFHHRYGKTTGTHHVCHRAARNHSHATAGKYGNFGRTTRSPPCHCIGQIDEKLSHSCFFKICTEKNKQKYEGG